MNKTYLIAEAGVNHNGSLDMAKQLVEVAASAGVDAVKFQTFSAEKLVTRSAPKAAYQTQNTGQAGSQLEMLKKLELSQADHFELERFCTERKIEFLSTAGDPDSLDFLVRELKLSRLKLGSSEVTNAPLLLQAARAHIPVILSTGMSDESEVRQALSILAFGYSQPSAGPSRAAFEAAFNDARAREILRANVTILHCTTDYPAVFEEANLMAMDTLRERFGVPVGFSDHTPGITLPIAAVARGAVVIEKHFTLDKGLEGPDHRASLDPQELRAMVRSIREVEVALGDGKKRATSGELKNRDIARKSLVATRPIQKGERFAPENLGVKRPGNGVSPVFYWDWIGRVAEKDYSEDELIGEP